MTENSKGITVSGEGMTVSGKRMILSGSRCYSYDINDALYKTILSKT
jgi:hypothetical protein